MDTNLRESFPSIGCYDLANKFNEHFIIAVNELKNKIAHPDSLQSPSSCVFSAYMPDVTEVELWQGMRTMPLTKPPGFDRVRVPDLIFNFSHLKNVLLHIINQTLNTGIIQKDWKIGVVRPLHKKGSRKDHNNYRPISIQSTILCIIEKILQKSMTSFCETHNLLSTAQYGFRSGLSTTSLLEDFNDYVCSQIDKNNLVIAL